MNRILNKSYLRVVLITVLLIVPCCGHKSYEKQQFLINAQRIATPWNNENKNIIEVRRFTIDPAYNTNQLIYRVGQFKYESDFYNEFLVSPAVMITEKVRNWLSASGLSRMILEPGSYVEPTHIIEGNIVALYGDFRDMSSPEAVMEIRIFLLETRAGMEPNILFGNTYKSSVKLESKGPQGLVAGFDKCLENILTNLETDLGKKLN